MAAKSPIETVIQNWHKRASAFQSQGVPAPVIQNIAQQDINKVATGSSGLSDQEAELAIKAAAQGAPVIQPPQRGTTPLDVIGNIPKDTGEVLKGLVTSLPRFFYHLPSETRDTVRAFTDPNFAAQQGYEQSGLSPGGLAAALRNVAKLPLAPLVPGLHTAAELTTSSGRKSLEQHPVGTLVDVAAAAAPGIKAAGELGLAKEGLVSPHGLGADPAIPTTPEALKFAKQENPLSYAMAGGLGKTLHYGTTKLPIVGEYLTKLDAMRGVARGQSEEQAIASAKFGDQASIINDAFKDITPEEQVGLFEAAIKGIARPTEPKLAAAYDAYRAMVMERADRPEIFPLKVGDKTWHYNGETGAGATIKKLFKTSSDNLGLYDRAKAKADDARIRVDAKVKKLRNDISAIKSEAQAKDRFHQSKLEDIRSRKPTPRHRNMELARTLMRKADAEKYAKRIGSKEEFVKRVEGDRTLAYHTKQMAKYEGEHVKANQRLFKTIMTTAPVEFHPLLADILRSKVQAYIGNLSEPPHVIDSYFKYLDDNLYAPIIGKGELAKMAKDIEATWMDLAAKGHDPIFVHTVLERELDRQSVKPLDHNFTPGQLKARSWWNVTPTVQNLAVALSQMDLNEIHAEATQAWFENHIVPHALTLDQARAQIEGDVIRATRRIPAGKSQALISRTIFDKNFERIDPEALKIKLARPGAFSETTDMFLPKYLANEIRSMAEPFTPKSAIGRAGLLGNNVFKATLFALSIKHFSHIVLGGFTAMIGRGGIEDLTSAFDAYHMVRDGTVDPRVAHSLSIDTPETMYQQALGSKAAKIMEGLHGKLGALQRVETLLSNVERTMGYLGEYKRSLKAGLSEEASREMGMAHLAKFAIDWHGMLPIERTVVRQIFPFYAFTAYAMRYILTYPMDHPYRASIITHIAQAEEADMKSGLPQTWQQLFFLGKPDSSGNITALDVRSINPFRDIADNFTLTGFFRSLGPEAGIPLDAAGLNKLTGTPELYPNVTYDPTTNRLVTTRRPMSENVISGIESFIPPLNTLDHFIGLSQRTRNLKNSGNKAAYRAQLYSALNLPFAPNVENIQTEMAKGELARFRAAQQAVGQAEKTGSTASVDRFNVVPYQGELITPQMLDALLGRINPPKGVAKKAVMTPPKRTKNRLQLPNVPSK